MLRLWVKLSEFQLKLAQLHPLARAFGDKGQTIVILDTSISLRDVFTRGLPYWPYATDDFTRGMYRMPQQRALSCRYIEANPPNALRELTVDVDRKEAGAAWHDAGLPPPNYVVINRENEHAHLMWVLKIPVFIGPNSRSHPVEYLSAVEAGFINVMRADPAYGGKIVKNPFHDYWDVREVATTLYTLGQLYQSLPPSVSTRKPRREEYVGESRHLDLFDGLRRWTYRISRSYREGASFHVFLDVLEEHAHTLNVFDIPLTGSAISSIVRSVADFCWHNAYNFGQLPLGGVNRALIHSRDRLPSTLTPEQITQRQREGAAHSAKERVKKNEDRVIGALGRLIARGMSNPSARMVAAEAGVSLPTAIKYLKGRAA